MPRLMSCLLGHQWEVPLDDGATEMPCPICAAPGQTVSCAPPSPGAAGAAELPEVPGYELLEELGRGGMGVVYKARQIKLNRLVALKMILAGGHASEQELARFQAEAEVIAALHHPGIVQVHAVGVHAGLPWFALEYCPGGSLADRLTGAPLPAREAAGLVEQLARAVQFAHERGIIHRDLKPANVLLADVSVGNALCGVPPPHGTPQRAFPTDLTPKITDFGLARRLESGGGLTQTGAVLGTPSYMAPEQAAGQKDVAPAIDVYALGAILYECLAGRPPFRAATALETLAQVLDAEPAPPSRLNPAVPRDLETVCLKCLAKSPQQRYSSAAELADELGRFLAGEPVRARPVSSLSRVWRWARRKPLLAAMAAVTLAALLAGSLVPTWLGLLASAEARRANQREEEAAAKGEEARLAAERLEETLAAGLLRPVGSLFNSGLHDTDSLRVSELIALEELARLPRGSDRVRLLFIARALERRSHVGRLRVQSDDRLRPEDQVNLATTTLLSTQMDSALVAAVGLRRDLREQVVRLAAARLLDPAAATEVRRTAALALVCLHCEDPDLAAAAAGELIQEPVTSGWPELAVHIRPEQASSLARQIIALVGPDLPPGLLPHLARAFTALASARPAGELKDEKMALARKIVAPTTPNAEPVRHLTDLAKAFEELTNARPAKELDGSAGDLARRIVEHAGKEERVADLARLYKAFAALAKRLPPEQAVQHAASWARIIESVGRSSNPAGLASLSEILKALPKTASVEGGSAVLATRVVSLASGRVAPQEMLGLCSAFSSLADQLPSAVASKHAAVLAGAVEKLAPRPGVWEDLARAFVTISPYLPRERSHQQAANLAEKILARAAASSDSVELANLTDGFTILAGRLPDEQARRKAAVLCRRLAAQAATAKGESAVWRLSAAFARLAGKHPDEQAGKDASILAKRLLDFPPIGVDQATGQPLNPLDDERGDSTTLLKLTKLLSGEQSSLLARLIVGLAQKTAHPMRTRELHKMFVALADKLPGEERKEHVSLLVRAIRPVTVDTPIGPLKVVEAAVVPLAPLLTEEQASSLARRLLPLASSPNPGTLYAIAGSLLVLAPRTEPSLAGALAVALPRLRCGGPLNPLDDEVTEPEGKVPSLAPLLRHISDEVLIGLLKQLRMGAKDRTAILEQLGTRFGRKFRHVWDLVDHLDRTRPDIDLAEPLSAEK